MQKTIEFSSELFIIVVGVYGIVSFVQEQMPEIHSALGVLVVGIGVAILCIAKNVLQGNIKIVDGRNLK